MGWHPPTRNPGSATVYTWGHDQHLKLPLLLLYYDGYTIRVYDTCTPYTSIGTEGKVTLGDTILIGK